jgi:hypothetical protein
MSNQAILVEFGGKKLLCEIDYSPSTPDVMYLPNGDPGYPGDPEEFEITKVSLKNGESWIDITELVYSLIGDGEPDDRFYPFVYSEFCRAQEPDYPEERDYDR